MVYIPLIGCLFQQCVFLKKKKKTSGTPIFNCQLMLDFCLKDYLLEKKKCVNICLGAHLIFQLPPPNPTIFTLIEPLVFKFSISMFYTSILQDVTLSLPPILFVLQICEHCEGWSFMSNPPQTQRIIKVHLQFLSVSLFHSLSLLHFFLIDFSSKFVWHKNFEGVPNFAWGYSYFFFKGKQIKKFKLLYIIFFFRAGCSQEHPTLRVASPLYIWTW